MSRAPSERTESPGAGAGRILRPADETMLERLRRSLSKAKFVSPTAGPFEAEILQMGAQGDGVAASLDAGVPSGRPPSGPTVFAPFTLPGERVRLEAKD